ncbi:MAG: capsular biosynthesis protein [Muribaculaceae bacterium]|nr:capsular biosynthesis protein [Muribaculaceae bacterium]
MWPFKKSVSSLQESGMFKGFTDWHSHILPGVDDGIKTLDDSLTVLTRYEELGFRKVWLTPHVMEDYPNEPEKLKEVFATLKDAWKGNVELSLAAENMIDNLFDERLSSGQVLPIGDHGQHLLVETSYFTPPMDFEEQLENVMSKGFFPLLAHPERYQYMAEKDYKRLKEMGVLFQSNFMSIVGAYGDSARKKLEWLLDNGMVDLAGSDVHRLPLIDAMIAKSPSKRKYLDALLEVAGKSID